MPMHVATVFARWFLPRRGVAITERFDGRNCDQMGRAAAPEAADRSGSGRAPEISRAGLKIRARMTLIPARARQRPTVPDSARAELARFWAVIA